LKTQLDSKSEAKLKRENERLRSRVVELEKECKTFKVNQGRRDVSGGASYSKFSTLDVNKQRDQQSLLVSSIEASGRGNLTASQLEDTLSNNKYFSDLLRECDSYIHSS